MPVTNAISRDVGSFSNISPPNGFTNLPVPSLGTGKLIYWDYPNIGEFIIKPIGPSTVTYTNYIISYCKNAAFFDYAFTGDSNALLKFSIRVINGSSVSAETEIVSEDNACFPLGSLISTPTKIMPIESISVGQEVIGAFGEINCVIGIQRVFVGKNKLVKINKKHITTDHHPHISPTKQFFVFNNIESTKQLYDSYHLIYNGENNVMKKLEGLQPSRLNVLSIGQELKTVYGCEVISLIEDYVMNEQDILYNLVVSGSHTYCVNGFAVTGWPTEKDFDYDTWSSKND